MYSEGEAALLPEAVRQAVRAAASGQVVQSCDDVGAAISRARRRRDAAVRASLAAIAAGFTLSTAQLTSILKCLSYSPHSQVLCPTYMCAVVSLCQFPVPSAPIV